VFYFYPHFREIHCLSWRLKFDLSAPNHTYIHISARIFRQVPLLEPHALSAPVFAVLFPTNTVTLHRQQRWQEEESRRRCFPFSPSSSLLSGTFLATYSKPNLMTLLHVSYHFEEEMTWFTFFVAVKVTLWRHGCVIATEILQK
jgi:hypothetical protein